MILWLFALALTSFSSSAHADDIHAQDLTGCFGDLRPFTTTGMHALVYPNDQGFVFIAGKSGDKDGVFVYSDLGVSFVTISDAFAKKTIAFEVSSSKGAQSVIYQPGEESKRGQVWLRGAPQNGGSHNAGVGVLFKGADDPDKRASLEGDLDSMVRGMAPTWDSREDQLVQAVEAGKYVWVEVDLENYKNAANKCLKRLDDNSETANLRASIRTELQALNHRAAQTGIVRDDTVVPSAFMTTPQY
jgi:hypothetical protein